MYIVEELNDFKIIPDDVLQNAYILGAGSNILVSDNGVNKPVIKIALNNILQIKEYLYFFESGINLSTLGKFTAMYGYDNLIGISGIPGLIGGAITMNASASKGSISDYLETVYVIDRTSRKEIKFNKKDCQFSFRESIFKNNDKYIIIGASFNLKKNILSPVTTMSNYLQVKKYRLENYPLTFSSAGCCFKGDWGKKDVIEKINMVSKIEGDAIVSPMFPAFILNMGKATAKDVMTLIKKIQTKALIIGEQMPLEIITWGEI